MIGWAFLKETGALGWLGILVYYDGDGKYGKERSHFFGVLGFGANSCNERMVLFRQTTPG